MPNYEIDSALTATGVMIRGQLASFFAIPTLMTIDEYGKAITEIVQPIKRSETRRSHDSSGMARAIIRKSSIGNYPFHRDPTEYESLCKLLFQGMRLVNISFSLSSVVRKVLIRSTTT